MPSAPLPCPTTTILDSSAMSLQFLRAAIEDVPEARMCEQFGPIVNHPAWTLAHLGAYAALLLDMFDDPTVPPAQEELDRYGYGSTPVSDPAAYPGKDELLARLTTRHDRLARLIADKHAAYFPRPTPEKYRNFTHTIGHITVILLVSHPSYHLGQIRQWRRAAGMNASQ